MKAQVFPIVGFTLAMGGVVVCWVLTMLLDHNDRGLLPYISETGTHAPERYIFTFTLSTAAALFALSGYLLFRYLQDRFQDLADYYYGFAEAAGDQDDGRYHRDRIRIWGSERMMLYYLPKANYAALVLSLLACVCLMILAIVDLKDAKYYHGVASALFFMLGLMQSLFLTLLTYCIRRVEKNHTRAGDLRFYARVIALGMCLFCTFPIAVFEGLFITLAGVGLSNDGRHNIGVINQYLLTMSLMTHFATYYEELRVVRITLHLQFDSPNGIITLGGRRPSYTQTATETFFDEPSSATSAQTFSIGEVDENGEGEDDQEQGIRFVNKGSSVKAEKEMQEVIPIERLDLALADS